MFVRLARAAYPRPTGMSTTAPSGSVGLEIVPVIRKGRLTAINCVPECQQTDIRVICG
jgi:hypothetical protein